MLLDTDELASLVLAKRRKLKRLEDNVRKDRERLDAMKALGASAELLKPIARSLGRGTESVMVMDYARGTEVAIPLDPARTGLENMARLFHAARRAARGIPIVEARLLRIAEEVARCDRMLSIIEEGDVERIDELERELGVANLPSPSERARTQKVDTPRRPGEKGIRRFRARDGSEIWVGRSATDNDRLVCNLAKGHDLWFHARGTAGAHVVLRLAKGASPGEDALIDAAHLAAHHSSARNDAKVEITYTEARYVKKLRGAPPGQVGVSKARTILVAMEPARLDRLLERDALMGHDMKAGKKS